MLKLIIDGVKAGIMIAIGGSAFLACENRYLGAALFSVALLCICLKGYSLYTGKVCYLFQKHDKETFKILFTGLFGNIISTVSLGFVIAYANPVLKETALSVCETKLLQSPLQTLIRAFFCGILVYMAVSTFREKGTLSGIFLCVPAFVVAGFEHSIANMFYFGAAGIISFESLIYLTIVVLGNSIGGLAMPFLSVIGKASPENA